MYRSIIELSVIISNIQNRMGDQCEQKHPEYLN